MTMTVAALAASVARRIGRLPEIDGRAAYPGPDRIGPSPFVVIRESHEHPTAYTKARAGQWVVQANLEALVLVAKVKENEKPRDEAKIDGIVPRLLSLFDFTTPGTSPNRSMPDLPAHVDRIWTESRVKRGTVTWNGDQTFYAAIVPLNASFHTQPMDIESELLPLEGTP